MSSITKSIQEALRNLFPTQDEYKQLKRELSLAKLNDEDTTQLERRLANIEKNLDKNKRRGTSDTGPR